MSAAGLQGVSRGGKEFTTIHDEAADRPEDLVNRSFTVSRPDGLWVSDLTCVRTLAGFVYVAFVIDAFARRLCGRSR